MDVLDHLIGEHRKAEQLVARLETTKTRAERQPVVAELGHALAMHMEVEERRVYPMIEEHLGEDKATGAEAEHDKARDGLAKLTEVIDQPAFAAALGEFKGDLAHHVTKKRPTSFPRCVLGRAARLLRLATPRKSRKKSKRKSTRPSSHNQVPL